MVGRGVEQRLGSEAPGGVPVDADIGFLAAQFGLGVAGFPAFEVGFAHHRIVDAGLVIGPVQETVVQHLGRPGVKLHHVVDADDPAVAHHGLEGAEVAGVEDAARERVGVDRGECAGAHQAGKAKRAGADQKAAAGRGGECHGVSPSSIPDMVWPDTRRRV